MIIKNSKIARFLKAYGIVLFPFIFISHDEKYFEAIEKGRYKRLIIHEKIHYKQQLEMLVIPFYAIYIINFVLNLISPLYKGPLMHKNIVFEKEAYDNEYDNNYLENRKFWAWFKYIFGKTIR